MGCLPAPSALSVGALISKRDVNMLATLHNGSTKTRVSALYAPHKASLYVNSNLLDMLLFCNVRCTNWEFWQNDDAKITLDLSVLYYLPPKKYETLCKM